MFLLRNQQRLLAIGNTGKQQQRTGNLLYGIDTPLIILKFKLEHWVNRYISEINEFEFVL